MTPSQVEASLLERDLVMLMKYAERHLLPARRLQLQVARVAQYVHADSTKPLSHYDIASIAAPAEPNEDETAEDVGAVFAATAGGNVVMLKGRKRKAG